MHSLKSKWDVARAAAWLRKRGWAIARPASSAAAVPMGGRDARPCTRSAARRRRASHARLRLRRRDRHHRLARPWWPRSTIRRR
ncbi:hypothetical protein LP420_36960 [Massilia sp. B-10]|nr:hypothetical protein LP420_36960 [Massilia sp. B-10]